MWTEHIKYKTVPWRDYFFTFSSPRVILVDLGRGGWEWEEWTLWHRVSCISQLIVVAWGRRWSIHLHPVFCRTFFNFSLSNCLQVKEVPFCLFGTGLDIKGPLSKKRRSSLPWPIGRFSVIHNVVAIALWRWWHSFLVARKYTISFSDETVAIAFWGKSCLDEI